MPHSNQSSKEKSTNVEVDYRAARRSKDAELLLRTRGSVTSSHSINISGDFQPVSRRPMFQRRHESQELPLPNTALLGNNRRSYSSFSSAKFTPKEEVQKYGCNSLKELNRKIQENNSLLAEIRRSKVTKERLPRQNSISDLNAKNLSPKRNDRFSSFCDTLVRKRPKVSSDTESNASKSPKVKNKDNGTTTCTNCFGLASDYKESPKKKLDKRPLTSSSDILTHMFTSRTRMGTAESRWLSGKDSVENLPPISSRGFGLREREDSHTLIGGPGSGASTPRKNAGCTKCKKLQIKYNSQLQVSKTLEEQTMCLENLVAQKKSLVEQLTKQIQMLVRENQKLCRKRPTIKYEPMITTTIKIFQKDEITTTEGLEEFVQTASADSKEGRDTDDGTRFTDIGTNPQRIQFNDQESQCCPELGQVTKRHQLIQVVLEELSVTLEAENVTSALCSLAGNRTPGVLEFTKCKATQAAIVTFDKSHIDINRFLADLLYTLNARGYESITDQKGNSIDLFRCKGEAYLELKGRDARLRTPVKRVAPQDTLLKAVIGSQERIIQNLMCQLEDIQRYALTQSPSVSSGGITSSNNGSQHRNVMLEGEIMSLISLLEGACQRNAVVYQVLREQQAFDAQVKAHSGVSIGNAIVELALERCRQSMHGGIAEASVSHQKGHATGRQKRVKVGKTLASRSQVQLNVVKTPVIRTLSKQDVVVSGLIEPSEINNESQDASPSDASVTIARTHLSASQAHNGVQIEANNGDTDHKLSVKQ